MKYKFGTTGIIIGGLALILALVHFSVGPFSPAPREEVVVAEKAQSLRQLALAALTGKKQQAPAPTPKTINADILVKVVTTILAGLSFILAVTSYTQKEPKRLAQGAAALGIGAVAFQFIAIYAVTIVIVLAIVFVLSQLGDGF